MNDYKFSGFPTLLVVLATLEVEEMTAFGWWSRVAALVVKTWINITTGQTYVCLFVFFFVESSGHFYVES